MTNGHTLHMWREVGLTAVAIARTQPGLSSALFSSLGPPQRRPTSPLRPFFLLNSLRHPSASPLLTRTTCWSGVRTNSPRAITLPRCTSFSTCASRRRRGSSEFNHRRARGVPTFSTPSSPYLSPAEVHTQSKFKPSEHLAPPRVLGGSSSPASFSRTCRSGWLHPNVPWLFSQVSVFPSAFPGQPSTSPFTHCTVVQIDTRALLGNH